MYIYNYYIYIYNYYICIYIIIIYIYNYYIYIYMGRMKVTKGRDLKHELFIQPDDSTCYRLSQRSCTSVVQLFRKSCPVCSEMRTCLVHSMLVDLWISKEKLKWGYIERGEWLVKWIDAREREGNLRWWGLWMVNSRWALKRERIGGGTQKREKAMWHGWILGKGQSGSWTFFGCGEQIFISWKMERGEFLDTKGIGLLCFGSD